MSNMFKWQKFINLILTIIVFSYLTVTYAAEDTFFTQEVYLADEPLPKIAARLKAEGVSQDQIVKYLKNILPKITSELAQEKFGIKWIDNISLKEIIGLTVLVDGKKVAKITDNLLKSQQVYPAVAICYMGEKVGYGLFAMEDIKSRHIIAEYTGKHFKNSSILKESAYVATANTDKLAGEWIDAKHEGNAARFAGWLPDDYNLNFYQYKNADTKLPISKNDIAIHNSFPLILSDDLNNRSVALMASLDIKVFEQIGNSYSDICGYDGTPWPNVVQFFDKNGEIIPDNKYYPTVVGVVFFDQIGGEFTPPIPLSDVKTLHKSFKCGVNDDYAMVDFGVTRAIVDLAVWKKQLSSSKNRISIPSYFITQETDIEKFVSTLKRAEKT